MSGKLADLQGFSHSLIPRDTLRKIQTIFIDLTKSEEELYKQLHRTTRNQIKKSTMSHAFSVEIIKNPQKEDIRSFQKFYNKFTKMKKIYPCNAFHVNTMNRLKEKNALIITRLVNEQNEILCYRVYITDGEIAFSLYSASHHPEKEKPEERRLLSQASRYLLWHNVLYFKRNNHKTYDMGGVTRNENIRNFKMQFGGELIDVYSGYEALSFVGKLVLWLRSLKMREG